MFLTNLKYDRLSWLCAFLARWILLSWAWCVLHYAPVWLTHLPDYHLALFLLNHLSGPIYHPWSLWFIDYYWLAFTLAGPLYFFDQRGRFLLNNDKYTPNVQVFGFDFMWKYSK